MDSEIFELVKNMSEKQKRVALGMLQVIASDHGSDLIDVMPNRPKSNNFQAINVPKECLGVLIANCS